MTLAARLAVRRVRSHRGPTPRLQMTDDLAPRREHFPLESYDALALFERACAYGSRIRESLATCLRVRLCDPCQERERWKMRDD
eukprot:2812383-Prymnesium_polylepis.1